MVSGSERVEELLRLGIAQSEGAWSQHSKSRLVAKSTRTLTTVGHRMSHCVLRSIKRFLVFASIASRGSENGRPGGLLKEAHENSHLIPAYTRL